MSNGDQRGDKSPLRALIGFLMEESWLRLRNWVRCGVVFLAALLAIGAFSYFSAPVTPAAPVPRAKLTVPPASGSGVANLTISVAPPSARSEKSAILEIDAWVVNNTGQMGKITAQLIPVNGCEQLARSSSVNLDAAGSGSIVATIDARNCLGTHPAVAMPIEVEYWWQAASSGADAKQAASAQLVAVVSTSPIAFERNAEEGGWPRLRGAVSAIYTVLRDLIWPVVLALLAFVLQEIQKSRDDAQKAIAETLRQKEETIAAGQRASEEQIAHDRELEMTRRAERQQTLTHLIPEYISLVQDHYLPIARRMQTVEDEWMSFLQKATQDKSVLGTLPEEIADPEQNPYTRLLSAILLMRRRVQLLFSSKGGVFFRTSIGEELFADCISEFFRKCHEFMDRDTFESAALSLGRGSTLPESIRRLFSPAAQQVGSAPQPTATVLPIPQAVMLRFQASIIAKDGEVFLFDRYVNLLRICEQILSFECDRTFYQTNPGSAGDGPESEPSGWYFDAPKIEISEDMYEIPAAMTAADDNDANNPRYTRAKVYRLLDSYREGIPNACVPESFPPTEKWLKARKNQP